MLIFLLFIVSISANAQSSLTRAAQIATTTLENVNRSQGGPLCEERQNTAQKWAEKNIQQLSNIPEANRGSLYYMISVFQCRLDNWRSFKPFYDKLFSQPEIARAYPDALPQNQTDNGFFIRILNSEQKITDDSPLSHLKGKTIGELFGYEGDDRLIDTTPAMGSRQLLILQPYYFTHQHTGRYNTGYHEFGHVLHLSLMAPGEYRRIEELYSQRKASRNFMDNYAGQSSSEYFAQGLEAYLSETKSKLSSSSEKHTRQDLRDQDPALYEFIESFVDNSSEVCTQRLGIQK